MFASTQSPAAPARRLRRRKSRGIKRRERAQRFAAWLLDVQDSYSDTAR